MTLPCKCFYKNFKKKAQIRLDFSSGFGYDCLALRNNEC